MATIPKKVTGIPITPCLESFTLIAVTSYTLQLNGLPITGTFRWLTEILCSPTTLGVNATLHVVSLLSVT